MAIDSAGKGEAKPPISLHPAFPAVVALWFAALLGLGSLVLPPILLERAIEMSGIARFVPAATAPLGFTARGMIAAAAAVLGALLGLVLAWQVGRAHGPGMAPRFSPAATRRPFSAQDELGDDGIAAPVGPKRRSLAMAEDERPSDFLTLAPLPGEDVYAPPAAEPATFTPAVAELSARFVHVAAAEEPLELSELAVELAPEDSPEGPAAAPQPQLPVPDVPQDPAMTDEAPAQFPRADELERRREERRASAASKGPAGLERRLYLRRTNDEPIAFIAPSLARRAPVNENAGSESLVPPVAVRVSFSQPPEPESERNTDLAPEFASEVTDSSVPQGPVCSDMPNWETAPLEELGMVQLVQRLGASLEKRREQALSMPQVAAGAPPTAPAPVPILQQFEAAPAEEAAQAMAAYFGRAREEGAHAQGTAEPAPAQMFTRSSPVEDDRQDEDEDDQGFDLASSFSLPLRRAPAASDPFADFDEPVNNEEEDEPVYGSLLGLRNPFENKAEEFVRVEEPVDGDAGPKPTVIFPGRDVPADGRAFDPPAPGCGGDAATLSRAADPEADEALRRALLTLQKMSQSG